jgi:nitroreductase/NAD-dependent dihydropyrimidine dehydrogenase PreA subunit
VYQGISALTEETLSGFRCKNELNDMTHFSIDREKCKRDGICVSECPARIIQIKAKEDFPALIEGGEEFCINCGHCVAVCPNSAFALSTMKPDQCPSLSRELLPGAEAVEHLLRSRRSIRTFRDKAVEQATLGRLIETATYAPSGHNSQPVHWLVIQEKVEVNRLAALVIDWMHLMIENQSEIAQTLRFDRVIEAWQNGVDRVLRGAPHLIVAHGATNVSHAQNACIIALTYLELAAYSMGLGACWAGYFNRAATSYPTLQETLVLPADHQSYGAMMVGHPTYRYQRIPLRNNPRIVWR